MSPLLSRPQKISDNDILAAAYRVMNRVAPSELTLAAIADEAGVTAGLLVQRFGSKHELMVRLAEGSADASTGFIDQMRAAHDSPLDALRAYIDCMAGLASSPAALVRSLAYLTEDLSDPDLRRNLERQARSTRAGLESLIRDAVARGELTAAAKPRVIARLVETMIPGSMMSWATYREGTAAKWMRQDLEAVLAPYLRTSRHRRRSPARP